MKKKLGLVGLAVVLALSMVLMLVVPAGAAGTNIMGPTPIVSPGTGNNAGVGVHLIYPTSGMGGFATTNPGGYMQVTVSLTTNSSDYYDLVLMGDPNPTPPIDFVCFYQELIYLNAGNSTITRLVSISPGVPVNTELTPPGTGYSLTALFGHATSFNITPSSGAGVAMDYEPGAIQIGPVPGGTIPMILGAKALVIAESVLDKFVTPSKINDLIETGNAPTALTPQGQNLIDGISGIVGDGVGMIGGVVSNVKGAVVSKVPDIINGGLSLAGEVMRLLSTDIHMAP